MMIRDVISFILNQSYSRPYSIFFIVPVTRPSASLSLEGDPIPYLIQYDLYRL